MEKLAQQPVNFSAKCLYYSISPSTLRFHRLMSIARRRGSSWQDIIRLAIDEYLAKFPQESLRKS